MLQFDTYFFPVISVTANPKFDPADKEVHKSADLDINGSFGVNDDGKTCRAMLEIKVSKPDEDTQIPYEIELTAVGSFTAPPGLTTEELDHKAPIFAFSVLYSSSREMALNLTSRGPWKEILLPVHTFQTTGIQKPEQQTKQTKTKSKQKEKS